MPVAKKLPTQETLQRLLTYDPETGKLYWKYRELSEFNAGKKHAAATTHVKWNRRFAEKEAFTAIERRRGYERGHVVGIIFNVRYKAHRIIWKLVYGKAPKSIDHIDGNPENNRLNNLRSVTHQTNMRNQKLRSTNTSGVNGVRWNAAKKGWDARAREGPKNLYLGRFPSFEEACAARKKHDDENGFHKNHGGVRA